MACLGLVAAIAVGGAAYSSPELPDGAQAAPPAPPPLLVRQIAPEQALQVNQTIPIAAGPNPAARPFAFKGNSAAARAALECLASAVYYEAGDQDDNGERAVAQVVLNRVRHPAFPGSVCDVVYQGSTRATGCQFTFTCDGSLYRRPDRGMEPGLCASLPPRSPARSMRRSATRPITMPITWCPTGPRPWPRMRSSERIFSIAGPAAGASGRFPKTYSGREPNVSALRNAALAAEAATAGQAGSEVAQAIADIPGAQALPLTPSMRGDKRVAIRFNLTARKASEAAPHDEYVEKFKASDNLRWSLSDEAVAANQKPLGQAQGRQPPKPRPRPAQP